MDGMFLGTSSGVLLDNFDIERIECRGLQGTLFGKNTTGGILNVIRTPVSMSEFGADLSFTGGQYGRQDVVRLSRSPLSKTPRLKLFGASIQHVLATSTTRRCNAMSVGTIKPTTVRCEMGAHR